MYIFRRDRDLSSDINIPAISDQELVTPGWAGDVWRLVLAKLSPRWRIVVDSGGVSTVSTLKVGACSAH